MRSRYSLLILFRLLLLVGGVLAFVALWGNQDLVFTRLLLLILMVGLVAELLHYVNRTPRELHKFLDAIQYEDNNVHFNLARLGGGFRRLEHSFKSILQAIQQAKIEKEAQLGFLQVLLEQIPVGVLAVREDEAIEVMNRHAADLLHTPYTTSWSYLERVRPEFCATLSGNPPPQQTIQLQAGGQSHRLMVHYHKVRMLGVTYTLITFQDIGPEMERQELESWQKLIRILTHEIMNSITPLSSLSETLLLMLHTSEDTLKRPDQILPEDLEDIRYSLETLRSRSTGLMRFVEDYRRLYKVPTPQKKWVSVQSLFEGLHQFHRAQLDALGCSWQTKVEPADLPVLLDESLAQQAFINLITNALQAMENSPEPILLLQAQKRGDEVQISVRDTGSGIPADKLDKIFVPFFTTKTKGSGIGLSLCRQILFQHGGSLVAGTPPEGGAIFTLTFPNYTMEEFQSLDETEER